MTFASFTKYMIIKIKKHLKISRRKKQRIRTIFLELRKLDRYEGWSDIILLNSIVEGLIELGEKYGEHEIYSAFKEVSKDDYDSKEKRSILNNLKREAETKSVF